METILTPVDFSKASDNAAIYAAHLCRSFSTKLVLFHAYHMPPVVGFETGYIAPVVDMKVESEEMIKKQYFCSLFGAGLELLNVIKPGEEMSVERANTGNFILDKLKIRNHSTFFIYNKKVAQGIMEYINQYYTDMLIISPKNHNFFHD